MLAIRLNQPPYDLLGNLPQPNLAATDFVEGDAMTAHQFNDDALGRVLEDLAEHRRTLLATLGAVTKGGSPTTRRFYLGHSGTRVPMWPSPSSAGLGRICSTSERISFRNRHVSERMGCGHGREYR